MKRLLQAAVPLILLLACTDVTTTVQKQGAGAQAKTEDCNVQVFRDPKPQGPYEALGRIETHIQRNFFFGGGVQLEEAYKELRAKACELGGDGVIVDHVIETRATENTHIHVWATVIKLGKEGVKAEKPS